MADVYQIVTDRILQAMDAGVIPWHFPWKNVRTGAINRFTGRRYSVLNQMLLMHQGEYGTFRQWTDPRVGGRIRKGEHAEIVVFWKWPEDQEETKEYETDAVEPEKKEAHRRGPILKYYHVFHISQVEGVEPLKAEQELFETEPLVAAEKLLQDYIFREGIRFENDLSNEAYYSPAMDSIHVPGLAQYERAEEYYSTAFHEVVHSTGCLKRLARPGLQKVSYGTETYSLEELVAEIGSSCILHSLGIESDSSVTNSIAYVQGWMASLRNDRKMIVTAAAQAERAVRFMRGL